MCVLHSHTLHIGIIKDTPPLDPNTSLSSFMKAILPDEAHALMLSQTNIGVKHRHKPKTKEVQTGPVKLCN